MWGVCFSEECIRRGVKFLEEKSIVWGVCFLEEKVYCRWGVLVCFLEKKVL